jgi:hypothetical protein
MEKSGIILVVPLLLFWPSLQLMLQVLAPMKSALSHRKFGRVMPHVGFVRHNKALHQTAKSAIQFIFSPPAYRGAFCGR